MAEKLIYRTRYTPFPNAPEAHKSIYVYIILLTVARSIDAELTILADRYIEGSMARGKADYSLETPGGAILGVTEITR